MPLETLGKIFSFGFYMKFGRDIKISKNRNSLLSFKP